MSADNQATYIIEESYTYVNNRCLALPGPVEVSYEGAAQRLVRRRVVLPSAEDAFLTLTIDAIVWTSGAILTILFFALLIATFGCGKPEVRLEAATQPAVSTVVDTRPVATSPLRVCLLQDKTGSSLETRTPLLTEGELGRVTHLCFGAGGEVTFGLISDASNHLFIRFTLEPPPTAPARQKVHEENPIAFEAADRKAQKEYDDAKANYDKARAAWEKTATERERTFLADVRQLLASAPDAQHTDVNGGIGRADLFLAEDDAVFRGPTHRYLVVVSDGVDNVRKPAPVFTSGATAIVVNGVGSVGNLTALHPHRFESVGAALNFITSKEAAAPGSR
jgi:hypothetical protein